MSKTVRHPITKGFNHRLEHERKERLQERAKQVEYLNATYDLIVKDN